MAEDLTPGDAPDDTPVSPAFEESGFEDTEFDQVRADLGDLTFLDPHAALADVPMPAYVWARLQGVIDAEAAARAVDTHENVVALVPPTSTPSTVPTATAPAARPQRSRRWAGGLVAASVAVVAVGLAVGTMRGGGQDSAIVAVSAPSSAAVPAPSAASADQPAGGAGQTAQGFAAQGSEVPASPEALSAEAATTIVPAARMVKTSQTNYVPAELRSQVVSLVKGAGFTTARDAMSKTMPPAAMPVGDGFTASWQALRDCVTWLTHSPEAQALIVDRATYDGNAAGVIVAPATLPDADLSTPSPTVTVNTGDGVFDVWVVNPECKQTWNTLEDFPLYSWSQ